MKKLTLILIVLISITACNHQAKQEPKPSKEPIQNIVTLNQTQLQSSNLVIGGLEKRNISTILKLNGKIDVPPQNMVSISMPLGGYLKSTKLLPGMHIKKGEEIATMEDQQYIQLQQDYLTAKSKMEFAENEYTRQSELNKTKSSSDKIFQQTKMEYQSQKIALAALTEKLKLIRINPDKLNENNLSRSVNIYSPIDGYVSKVNMNIGKYVSPSDILFELVNPTDIHLNLTVFEKDLNQLSIGQKLITYSNNEPDRKHQCEIILISKNVDKDRTADVHCHFEDYDKKLLPGMYMNAEVEIKSDNLFTISEEAIVNFEGKNYIFTSIENNKFQMEEVQTGTRDKGFIEIKNFPNFENKKIVNKGAYTLLMALKNKSEE